MHAYMVSYMYANGKVLNYVYTNGRVLRYVYIYINLVFIYVYTNGKVLRYVYVYICLHICAHNWCSALLYVYQWKRAQLYTTPDFFSMDIQAKAAGHGRLAAAVVSMGDHKCLWAAVIYFWSLL